MIANFQRITYFRCYHKKVNKYQSFASQNQKNIKSASGTISLGNPTSMLVAFGLGYMILVNVGSYGLFWYDKYQANARGWRIPEKTLQLSALLGGWIGGMAAMEHFRHKTVKQEFRIPYFACAGLNIAGLASLAYFAKMRGIDGAAVINNISKNLIRSTKPRG